MLQSVLKIFNSNSHLIIVPFKLIFLCHQFTGTFLEKKFLIRALVRRYIVL